MSASDTFDDEVAALIEADPGPLSAPVPDPGDDGIDEAQPNSGGPAREPEADRPFAVPIKDFIAAKTEAPPPLIGTEDDCILPAFGLLLYVAKGGKGKTTSTFDAVLHLASGLPWLGFEVPRPLRVLFVENEGPREPFRRKLERRLGHWPHPLTGGVYVYDGGWGQARLNEFGFVERLNRYVAEQKIDLIVGDPLDTLGMDGVGSPEDTRAMVSRFQNAGLFSAVAWWVLHHARKEKAEDAIDEASGSWAGKPDALLGLESLPGSRARLGFHKLRWGRRDGFTYLLSYDADTEAFEFLCEESSEERDYAAEIETLLDEHGWLTVREICAPTEKSGIGAGRDQVEEALKAEGPERFVSRSGEAAKAVGRHPNATVWGLASGQKPDEPDRVLQGVLAPCVVSGPALKGQTHTKPDPDCPDGLASRPEPHTGHSGCASHPEPVKGCRYCQGKAG